MRDLRYITCLPSVNSSSSSSISSSNLRVTILYLILFCYPSISALVMSKSRQAANQTHLTSPRIALPQTTHYNTIEGKTACHPHSTCLLSNIQTHTLLPWYSRSRVYNVTGSTEKFKEIFLLELSTVPYSYVTYESQYQLFWRLETIFFLFLLLYCFPSGKM